MRTNGSTTTAIVTKKEGTYNQPLLISFIVKFVKTPFSLSIPSIILALQLGTGNHSFFCDALITPSQSLTYIPHQLHSYTTFNSPSIKNDSLNGPNTTIRRGGNTRTTLLGWPSSPPLSSEGEKYDIDSNRIYGTTEWFEYEYKLEDRHLLSDINTILARYEPPLLKSLSSSLYDSNNLTRQRQQALLERDRRRMIAEKNITFRSNLQIKNLVEKSKREQKHQQHRIHACHTAEHILNLLEQIKAADTITYNGVINAYAKSNLPDSAQRAKAILLRMEKIHRADMLKRMELGVEEGNGVDLLPPVKPNVRSYSNVIDAYSRIAGVDNDAAKAAQSILEHLSSLYISSSLHGTNARDEDLKPNIISYNSVLNAWAKTGTPYGAMMAAKLLEEMEIEMDKNNNSSDCKSSSVIVPDVISYNAVIHAWARCGSEDSGERAEEVLRRMQGGVKEGQRQSQQQPNGHKDDEGVTGFSSGRENIDTVVVHPNTRTYSSVIDAWSRSNHPSAARRAHQILDEMERRYAQTGNSNVRPNTVAYSSVINAYARSRDMESKARSALGVLKKMEHLYRSGENVKAKPTIVTYNSVLNACASTYGLGSGSSDGRETENCHHQILVLDIVKKLYHQIISPQSEVCADHFTYGTVLKACANLTLPRDNDDGMLDFIHQVFSRCCEDGQVSFGVCFQLRQAAPYFYRELIPPEAMDVKGQFIMSRLPPKWCRNVKEKKRFPRKN